MGRDWKNNYLFLCIPQKANFRVAIVTPLYAEFGSETISNLFVESKRE